MIRQNNGVQKTVLINENVYENQVRINTNNNDDDFIKCYFSREHIALSLSNGQNIKLRKSID